MDTDNFKAEENLEEIVCRAQKDDLSAQECLVKKYQARIAGFVYSMLGNEENMEDVVQIVFIKMLKTISSLRKRDQFQSWLFRIARNTCLDHLRAKKWKQLFVRFASYHEEIPVQPARQFSDDVEWLLNELQTLPPNQREVMVLMQDDSLSYQDMANVLGCSLESVKSRIFRARSALNERRKNYAKSE